MKNKQMDKKIQHDTEEVKKGINTLVEDGVSQATRGLEKMTGEAKATLIDTAGTVKKEVGNGLTQYNAKAQELAEKLPGGLAEKAVKYPWVAISIGLAVGIMLGKMFKPSR